MGSNLTRNIFLIKHKIMFLNEYFDLFLILKENNLLAKICRSVALRIKLHEVTKI